MSTIKLRIAKSFDEQELFPGLPVAVRPIRRGQPDGRSRMVVVPLSDDATLRLPVDPGEYEIRVIMPSGEIREDTVAVSAGEVRQLILEPELNPNHHVSGEMAMLRSQLRSTPYLKSFGYDPGVGEDSASIGSNVRDLESDCSFPGDRWGAWHDWLDRRAERSGTFGAPALRVVCDGPIAGLGAEAVDQQRRLGLVDVFADFGFGHRSPQNGQSRPFLSVQHQGGVRIVSLPWPWIPDRYDVGPSLLFEFEWAVDAERLAWKVSLADQQYGGLLAYLSSGQVGRASLLLRGDAQEALFYKLRNPLAAALGGYVLLSTEKAPREADWPFWLENLTNWFPWLPDGPILRARWLLEHAQSPKDVEAARAHLLSACDRGVPFFSAGVTWLIEALRVLSVDCKRCAERFWVVAGVARSMDLTQPFSTFDLRRPKGQLDWDLTELSAGHLPTGASLGLNGVGYTSATARLTSSRSSNLLETNPLLPVRRETEWE